MGQTGRTGQEEERSPDTSHFLSSVVSLAEVTSPPPPPHLHVQKVPDFSKLPQLPSSLQSQRFSNGFILLLISWLHQCPLTDVLVFHH